MKQLVRIDPSSGRIIDIDQVKLKRFALELRNYLDQKLSSSDDIQEVKESFYPLCEAALNENIKESIPPEKLPLQYQRRERVYKEELNRLLAKFCVVLSGTPLEEITTSVINGVPHAYVEMEEP